MQDRGVRVRQVLALKVDSGFEQADTAEELQVHHLISLADELCNGLLRPGGLAPYPVSQHCHRQLFIEFLMVH